MKKYLHSTRGAALLLALSLTILTLCMGNVEKLRDTPLKAKAVWHATVMVAEDQP